MTGGEIKTTIIKLGVGLLTLLLLVYVGLGSHFLMMRYLPLSFWGSSRVSQPMNWGWYQAVYQNLMAKPTAVVIRGMEGRLKWPVNRAIQQVEAADFIGEWEYQGYGRIEQMEEYLPQISLRIDEFFKATGDIEFEVWIKDGLITKVYQSSEIDLNQLEDLKEQIESGTLKTALNFEFSNFDHQFEVQKPASSTPIQDFISSIFENPLLSE